MKDIEDIMKNAKEIVEYEIKHTDPVHEYEDKWWFWDETWSDRVGPYDTEKETRQKIKEYAEYLDGKFPLRVEEF